ncbi:MAG: hypothetical protein ACYC3H_12820 [Bellilinea sp.]
MRVVDPITDYTRAIFTKLNVSYRNQAVVTALRYGLVNLGGKSTR